MAKETRHLKLQRTGKEKAIIYQTNRVLGGLKNYTVGESFTLQVHFYHSHWITSERAYNILTRLQLPPYLSLVSVSGINRDLGDILYNATTSEKVIKVCNGCDNKGMIALNNGIFNGSKSLLTPSGRSIPSYNKICIKNSFDNLIYLNGRFKQKFQ